MANKCTGINKEFTVPNEMHVHTSELLYPYNVPSLLQILIIHLPSEMQKTVENLS